MRPYTLLWLLALVYVVAVEMLAYRYGGYWTTLTGHVVKVMLVHPVAACAVIGLVAMLAAHLLIDYFAVLRLR